MCIKGQPDCGSFDARQVHEVPAVIRVGSSCSGYGSEAQALESLRVPFQHIYTVEKEKHVRVLQRALLDSE
eukprot:15253823-Alexandrium_andersonii.AAC.1